MLATNISEHSRNETYNISAKTKLYAQRYWSKANIPAPNIKDKEQVLLNIRSKADPARRSVVQIHLCHQLFSAAE